MFEAIHNLLYDGRYIVLVLTLFPLFWSLWVFWSVLFVPSAQQTQNNKTQSKRHSHRLRAQQKVSTKTAPVGAAAAVAEPLVDDEEGSQSNLLDALAAEDEDDDEIKSAGFASAHTVKQAVDASVVNKLVDEVTDKVASQIEALTGETLQDDQELDVQDMLETVQEDSQQLSAVADVQDLTETVQDDGDLGIEAVEDAEQDRPEGDHTRALRKASKMEEIGFHRPSEDDDEQVEYSVLNSPEIADLGAKHIQRITELGLNEGVDPDKERLRTAQLDDILSRLDNVLENPDAESIADSFSHASTQEMPALTDEDLHTDHEITKAVDQQSERDTETRNDTNGFPIADVEPANQVETSKSDAVDRDALAAAVEADADEEAADFFAGVEASDADAGIVNPDDITVREESDDGEENADQPTIDANLAQDDDDEEEQFNLSEISAAIEDNLQAIDEQDQLDTVKVGNESSEASSDDEQDGLETIAVSKDGKEVDPNLETLRVEDEDDDLPAWARADSFDEDLDEDDDKPKQQNLFDS